MANASMHGASAPSVSANEKILNSTPTSSIGHNDTNLHCLPAADWCKGCYGVFCQEVDQDFIAEVRFLHEKAVRCTRYDCQLPTRQGSIEVNGMLKGDFIIITEHHQCSATDACGGYLVHPFLKQGVRAAFFISQPFITHGKHMPPF
jgi:hypothetical protein